MKLLIATDNYPPRYDGISRFLNEIIPFIKKHYSVQVIAPNYGPTSDPWPVLKIPLSRLRVGDFTISKLSFNKIREQVVKSDIIFLQTLGSIGFATWFLSRKKKIIIMYVHSVEWEILPKSMDNVFARRLLPGIVKFFSRKIHKHIDLLLMPSESVAAKYRFAGIKTPYKVVHLGVDTSKFVPPRSKDDAKRAIGYRSDEMVIGFHGRIAYEKDLKTLLRGFLRFKRKNLRRNPRLMIVGDGLESIKKRLMRQGVTITGFKDDVVKYLQAMDVYVLSSLTETSCLSVMEAMACGLPVVSTPAGYVKDYIKHGTNGLLYPFGDSAQLAAYLDKLIDYNLRMRLGQAARRVIKDNFSWDNTRNDILLAIKKFDS